MSWIDLLRPFASEFDIQGLHISWAPPPNMPFPVTDAADPIRDSGVKRLIGGFLFKKPLFPDDFIYGRGDIAGDGYANLIKVLNEFQPDIIHTLGMFPASVFYLRGSGLQSWTGRHKPCWMVQARGGPDIAMNHRNRQLLPDIQAVFKTCDYFIADNAANYSLAESLGLDERKVSATGSVPGSGGVDLSAFEDVVAPSKKERIIIWPKAYNCIQSDGFAVVEALRLALPRIKNFRLLAFAAMPDVEYWFREYLDVYGEQVQIVERVERREFLTFLRSARVMLAPSLSEGVPNSMYEAMASHTVPILSPLDTLTPLFQDGVNTLYAPNLNPGAIANALVRAATDDPLADRIAINNKALLPSLASRDVIRGRVAKLYRQAASRSITL